MLIILDRRQPPATLAQGTPVNNYRIYNTYTSGTSRDFWPWWRESRAGVALQAIREAETIAHQFRQPRES